VTVSGEVGFHGSAGSQVGGGRSTDPAGEYKYFHGKGNENHELATEFFVHKIISAVKSVE
jgi:hypothetical protein